MSAEIYYYLCHKCDREGEEESCKLTVDTSPGIPTECPFGLGFTAEWEQVDKKEFNGN